MNKRALLFAIVCLVTGVLLGDSYIGRLPNYTGFWLVHGEDHVAAPVSRPRRLVVIVVDGLRRDSAETMRSAQRIARAGQCRISDQGSYTVSRPVYALLSTGLEVDRTGARNNDLTEPLDNVESVWEVARRAGLHVRGSSHLPWFKQLFPRGFDEFRHSVLHQENVFASTPEEDARFDIDLFHPLYVDENGHHHGGASPEYAAAVARADSEIAPVLDRLDLTRDTVILTADHGHRDQGGHGGSQPEIRNVLACFAGPNIAHREDRLPFDGRVTAPLISVLEGLPFPANMRAGAGEDGLDVIWDIVRFDPEYTRDRKAAIISIREQNRIALEGWLGGAPGTWARLYDRSARDQEIRIALCMIVAIVVFALRVRKDVKHAAWVVAAFVVIWVTHHVVLGDFDYTVVNLKEQFVPRAFLIMVIATIVTAGVHYAMERQFGAFAERMTTLILLILVMNLGHIAVYGWPLGFPLPFAAARYFPFMGAIAQAELSFVLAVLTLLKLRASRSRP